MKLFDPTVLNKKVKSSMSMKNTPFPTWRSLADRLTVGCGSFAYTAVLELLSLAFTCKVPVELIQIQHRVIGA